MFDTQKTMGYRVMKKLWQHIKPFP